MLDRVEYPISNFQIANFFLEREYTDYFRVQQAIGELQSSGLIDYKTSRRNTKYTITEEGKNTLNLLRDKLNEGIEDDIISYFKKNEVEIKMDNAVVADYYKSTGGGYAVRCQFKSRDKSLIDMTLAVKTKEQAEAICDNWKMQKEDVYGYLMELLMA
jgi:hypothetical protein